MSTLPNRNEVEELNRVLETAERQSRATWMPARGADPFATCVNRRAFMRGGAALIGGAALSGTLQSLMVTPAYANGSTSSPYGPPLPARDESTGLALIQLPLGFRYLSFGWTGDLMQDGIRTPALHDGMAVINKVGRKLILVRNHEVSGGPAFGPNPYSPGGGGGTSNLVFDTREKRFVSSFASLSGTTRNCAGGVTPWGTWLTCEEVDPDTVTAGNIPHGYVFEVGPKPVSHPVPLKAMGRFSHEAVTVDPKSGIVYETEDGPSASGDAGSGFYRFIPRVEGRLEHGGRLQMLKIAGRPQFNTRPLGSDGQVFSVEWVDIPNPDPNVTGGQPSVFQQGYNAGGASFRRLEGSWYGDKKIFFLSTDGGPVSEGQIWEYDPRRETLKVIFASPSQAVLENPDNLLVAPDGTILLCEDNSGATTNAAERLIFINKNGAFTFAVNNLNFTNTGLGSYTRRESGMVFNQDWRQMEWAGAMFSPNRKWLFVNIQTPGITFAITGPWTWLDRDDEDDDDD